MQYLFQAIIKWNPTWNLEQARSLLSNKAEGNGIQHSGPNLQLNYLLHLFTHSCGLGATASY
jgi:hypothetical protein